VDPAISLKGRILVVDNYDSFTFNLVHMVESIVQADVEVRRNDAISPEALLQFECVIFSPGPGLPEESPELMALVRAALGADVKVLGVCLGHQALAQATGARLKNLAEVHHGVALPMELKGDACNLFKGIEGPLLAGRYHSWVVDAPSLGADWIVTCADAEGEVMAMRHVSKPIFGIQFHPESVLTPMGKALLKNFLDL
jgi:anthranilate synthase component 2